MRIAAALLALLSLCACAKQQPEPAAALAPYCDVARPIFWSAKDSRATKEQADRENAKWKRLCSDRGAPSARSAPAEENRSADIHR
jgi:hypothetical protein